MLQRTTFLIILPGIIAMFACAPAKHIAAISKQAFGKMPTGEGVDIYTLTNSNGMEARITNFGGILVSLKTPDRDGGIADVVLGFDTFDEYLNTKRFYGAIVGRYANRIAKGRFSLDGVEYTLARNNGENSLHGGVRGFNKVLWEAHEVSSNPPSVQLRYRSKDGEEGYPGNLTASVLYTLTSANELRIDYVAETDKPTVVNLTNHSFFNLAGQGQGDVLGHSVTIDADRFTPGDAGLIPTGELRPVAGTPFDFRNATTIGARVGADDEQLKAGKGYDHNFVLNHPAGQLGFAARVIEQGRGRVMEVLTTEPGLQFYSGGKLDGTGGGKGGKAYGPSAGFCMEAQHFPNSPNHPEFPSTVLRPGSRFEATTIYRFRTQH